MYWLQYFKKGFITPPPTSTNILITYQAGSPFNTILNFTLSNTNGTITNNIDSLSYYYPTYFDTTLQTATSTNFTINSINPLNYIYSSVFLYNADLECSLPLPGIMNCDVYRDYKHGISDLVFTYYGSTHNYLGSNTVAPSALPVTYILPNTTYYIYVEPQFYTYDELRYVCGDCVPI